jgi:hypothetical protein
MRACLFLFGATLLVSSPVALSAQQASPAPQTPNAAAAAPAAPVPHAPATSAAPANPAAPGAQPAPNGQKVVCEYTTHDGALVPLNHCETQSEADKHRRERQQNLREIQMNSLTFFGPRP